MKDKNNLLTSLIVALLAGVAYYLAGSETVEKIVPQFSEVKNKLDNGENNDIEIVFSKVKGKETNLISDNNDKINTNVKFKTRRVKREENEFKFDVDVNTEIASSSQMPPMKFDDIMALLKDKESTDLHFTKLNEGSADLEWTTEVEVVEEPGIAWTQGDNSKSLTVNVKNRMPKVYASAKEAVFLRESKRNSKKHKDSKTDKKVNNGNTPASDKNGSTLTPEQVVIVDAKGNKVTVGLNFVTAPPKTVITTSKNENVNGFIFIQSDDDNCKVECKVKCKK